MNSMKQLQAQEEVRARREEEARRLRLEQETAADMAVLRAILDAERSACEIESAAEQYRAGLDGRIRAAKDELLGLIILVTAMYGLRRSEVLGLRWRAIDFENDVITINHTLTEVNFKGQTKLTLKPESGSNASTRHSSNR